MRNIKITFSQFFISADHWHYETFFYKNNKIY